MAIYLPDSEYLSHRRASDICRVEKYEFSRIAISVSRGYKMKILVLILNTTYSIFPLIGETFTVIKPLF